MAVDVDIRNVRATLTAQDPDLLQDEAFIAKIVAAVKAELEREELVKSRRESDRKARQDGYKRF